MRRVLAIALVLASALPASAKGDKGEDDEEARASDDTSDEDEDAAPKEKAKEAVKKEDEEQTEDTTDQALRPKQDLSGHDLGTTKRANEFEKDRFFVDKVDTEKTEEGTLVQGSITSSSFLYAERGGDLGMMNGPNTGPTRLFTELRLQTDFRHISASRWDARVDARVRMVNSGASTNTDPQTDPNRIQSGVYGTNEYDLRELWLIHSGKRSDVFIGRQFVPDLGGVKFDGLRIDYASSAKLTFIAFGGLYPVRGSRSIDTDYAPLKTQDGNSAGRFVTTGGAGAAYRTINSYGALGGVAMYPLQKESPRVYVTSTGYLRSGSKLDFYHFALVDLLGANATDSSAHVQLTNLSAGVNGKPNPRLRLTAAFNRVDTETLNIQAGAFLSGVDTTPGGNQVVQNEAYILRLATNSVRAGVSAGLGNQQRFELSTAVSYRNRPSFTLTTPDPMVPDVGLPAANSVEVWGGFVDRRSFANVRIGLDGSRSFGVGGLAYQRSEALFLRGLVEREFSDGKGEWEGEVSYTDIRDSVIGTTVPTCAEVASCYGTSNNKLMSVGGQVFYRLKTDWLGIATLHFLRTTNRRSDAIEDAPVLGITGFLRIAKRF